MTPADVPRHLLGADRDWPARYLLVAAFVFLAGLGLLYWRWRVAHRGLAWRPLGVDVSWIAAVVAVGLAAVPGVRDDGLLSGWLLGAAVAVAVSLMPVVVPTMAFDEPLFAVLAMALALGVGLGTVGFGLGAGVRWVQGQVG